MTNLTEWLLPWLLTYWIHSTLLLGALLVAERLGWVRGRALAESLWKLALVGGIVTASLQLGIIGRPLIGQYKLLTHSNAARRPVQTLVPESASVSAMPSPADSGRLLNARLDEKPAKAKAGFGEVSRTQPTPAVVPPWCQAILFFWLAGILLLAVRLTRAAAAARRELRGRTPLRNPAIHADVTRLARHAGLRAAPPVSIVQSLTSPVSLPNGEICLPEWALAQLNPTQLHALFAHEIAHCSRHDPRWLLARMTVRSLFFFQPLNVIADRRLSALAELACDDWAAENTGNGRALAECLAHCAEHITGSATVRFAPAMARHHDGLAKRVERLTRGVHETRRLPLALRLLILAMLPVVAFIAPGFGLATSLAATGEHSRIHSSVDVDENGHSLVAISSNGVQLQMQGKVVFNKDENGIARMAPGAALDVSEKRKGTRYRAYFRAASGNGIDRHFYINGAEKPFNAKASHWLARIIPAVLRNSGIDAAERVKRILAAHGPNGVLNEINKIESGYARSLYIQDFVATEPLATEMINRTIAQAGRINSDYQLGRSLKTIVASQSLKNAQIARVLAAAKDIKSDYATGQVLQTIAAHLASPDLVIVRTYLGAANGLRSDYAHSQALQALIKTTRFDRQELNAMLDSVRNIDSDHQRVQILRSLARQMPNNPKLIAKYHDLTRSMSKYMRRQAEDALHDKRL